MTIQDALKQKNMSIYRLAKASEVPYATVNDICNGKAQLGMSVGDYITKCKLEEACDLLVYGGRSLAEISAYLGYSSQSYFQNVFKKQLGITPMQYRNENRKAT